MQHKTLKATTTATDQGIFTALAATYSVDRVGDRIIKGAFGNTIAMWQESEKQIPVHWDHEGTAASVIGSVDPATMQETKDGLYVEGKLDLEDSETAREAWRSMKDNRVALSFGYMATRERKAKDGINELLEIDLFEVSIVPAPANPDTRLLSLKSAPEAEAAEEQEPPAEQELEQPVEDGPDEEPEEAKSAPQDPLRKRSREVIMAIANDGPAAEPVPASEPEPLNEAELRRRSERAALDIALG